MEYIERRLQAFAILAVVGFPLYYFVWHDLFPQHYENLSLRLIGAALYFPIIFSDRWKGKARRYLIYYWHAVSLYALPFFFTFMLLKNHMANVWLESALIAAFVMVMLLDWLTLLLHFVLGSGLAYLAYRLTGDPTLPSLSDLAHLAIFSFAMTLGALCNYDAERIRIAQQKAMLATAGSLAHELRTPLLAIRTGAAGLAHHLPILIESYTLARANSLLVPAIRHSHLNAIHGALERIEQEALHSSAMIDILLTNARITAYPQHDDTHCSAAACVRLALQRFPFREGEQTLVSCNLEADFEFLGSMMLIVHVLFNLLKNALTHMKRDIRDSICITLMPQANKNYLVFRDTGEGIPAQRLPHIFTRFHTTSDQPHTFGAGAGIGLAFCRDVMRACNGAIECHSVAGEYTEFILSFPTAK
ncbi:sensor histidine kinase [Caballeronia calidae]|nr:HAMP domain-containing sensor histidine kinase [Caballeronia calidae]